MFFLNMARHSHSPAAKTKTAANSAFSAARGTPPDAGKAVRSPACGRAPFLFFGDTLNAHIHHFVIISQLANSTK